MVPGPFFFLNYVIQVMLTLSRPNGEGGGGGGLEADSARDDFEHE